MFRKFAIRMFSIIFLPLVACQLPGGQAVQPTELPTLVPTVQPTIEPTPVPTATSATEPLPATGIPLCEPLQATDRQARYTSGLIIGDYIGANGGWPNDDSEIVLLNQRDEVSKVKSYVTEETYELLTNTNFDSHFIVVVFEGKGKNLVIPAGSPAFLFCISQWSRNEKDVILSLQLLEQDIVPAVVYYTYFCFQVTRDETWKEDFVFKLNQTRYTYNMIYHDGVVGETKFTFQ